MKNLCSDVPSGPPYIWHVNFVTRFLWIALNIKSSLMSHLSNLLLRDPQRAEVIEEIHRCVFQTPPQHEARARETDWATEHVVQRFRKKYFLRRKIFLAEKNISCGKKYFLRKKIYFLRRKIYFLRKKYISCGGKYISCGEKCFLRKKIFLAEKNISCGEKYISCGEKYISCGKNIFLAEKNIFLAEKNISCGKKIFLAEKYFCTMLPISFRNYGNRRASQMLASLVIVANQREVMTDCPMSCRFFNIKRNIFWSILQIPDMIHPRCDISNMPP